MAIKMVREPSETPNINNIDDIIPMRYAYGGQNGYVLGKGTEISNTVNGTNFVINSGRLILQGVECDIDASGVTITIDNIATKRYYVVYLQVNLATNKAIIDSEYDTADYPAIDLGDDLTENNTGTARMVLYRFTATNGVISNINKVIKEIGYPLNDFDINKGTIEKRIKGLDGYNVSKGTIEERLTRLGFRQGSLTLNSSTAQKIINNFKRQGNYVIFNIYAENLKIQGNIELNYTRFVIGTFNSDFIPKMPEFDKDDPMTWSVSLPIAEIRFDSEFQDYYARLQFDNDTNELYIRLPRSGGTLNKISAFAGGYEAIHL